jgi:cytoskeletal protein CcmA (bactofilin family)
MFRKAKNTELATKPAKSRSSLPSVITADVHLLGNLVSESVVDFAGTIDGNIRCDVLTLRNEGVVKGEIVANTVNIHGTVKGLIRAKVVNLLASCKVEGIIIHEQLSIEDGAFVDGKFKRSDRISISSSASDEAALTEANAEYIEPRPAENIKVLENIRLIR